MSAQTLTVVENETRRAPLLAGARPSAIVPQSMEEAYRIADAVCRAGMAPKGLDEPAKARVAIMHGLEVGLTPMAALQRIAVVNGRPTIWGDGAIGLVRGSGACEFIHETTSGEGDALEARCEAKRKGQEKPIVGTFSVADAKKAALWGKAGPWQQYPRRMLQMRARAFALRDGFADVLGGLYLREEIEDESRETRRPPTPAPEAAPAAPVVIENRPAVEVAKVEEKRETVAASTSTGSATAEAPRQRKPPTAPTSPAEGFEGYKARVLLRLSNAPDEAACERIWDEMISSQIGKMSAEQYADISAAAEACMIEYRPGREPVIWGE